MIRRPPRSTQSRSLAASDVYKRQVLEAEYLYADARAIDQGKPRCIDCLHWLVVKAECGLGLPEGRSTGGEWAKECACFWH